MNPRMVIRFGRHIGRLPNIANPRRYSERMLWRKLVDHSPQLVLFCDKLATKEFIRRRCPDLPVPRTLWSGGDVDAIPDDLFRSDVFVKANHGCDFNHRFRDGNYDRAILREKARRWLGSIHGKTSGEWAYSQVAPRLFVEEAVGDAAMDLLEFNVRASNGKAILGSVMGHSKTPAQWVAYFDPEGQPAMGITAPEGSPVVTPPPEVVAAIEPYRRAVEFTRRLSVGVDYARFDFFWNKKDLFAGEITVYPAAGNADPANSITRVLLENGWDLLQSHFLGTPHNGWSRMYVGALKRRLEKRTDISRSGIPSEFKAIRSSNSRS